MHVAPISSAAGLKLQGCQEQQLVRHSEKDASTGLLPTMTMKEEKRGTAMVTPAKHNEYIKPMLPKKMHTPDAIAKPMRGALACSMHHIQPKL